MTSRQPHLAGARLPGYRFGDFTLDLDAGFLRNGSGEEVPLRAKAFDVLVYLVERHGRLVTKAELLDAIWPDAAVTDNSLAQCLLDVRRAIGDESQQTIRTVARRGYVFAGPVVVRPASVGSGVTLTDAAPSIARRSGAHSRALGSTLMGVVVVGAALVVGGFHNWRSAAGSREPVYTQLTDLTDSAVAPALSPDGRMLAFIRGNTGFMTRDQIYVKLLPGGEPVQLTHDPRPKYHIAFSPDGSKLAYTVVSLETGPAQNTTYATSPLGGEATVLLTNAAGLTWLDHRRLLFSEVRSGLHMGIVTGSATRSDLRDVYFPSHERGMAHYAFASPDRQWALVIEMDYRPRWLPCRLVPVDGGSPGRPVGPDGYCTGAGWSPDGRWMYVTAAVGEKHHLWRQQFPDGQPEQLTFGPTDEDGIAVAPDGTIVTSVGGEQSELWIHDATGDRQLSSEGTVIARLASVVHPSFSRDGKHIYYLRRAESGAAAELWQTDLDAAHTQPLLPGTFVTEYEISEDRRVLYTVEPPGAPSQIWIAPLDRSSPPRRIAASGEGSPHFGRGDRVLYRFTKGNQNFVGQMNLDGSQQSQPIAHPISNIQNVSPDRRWLIAIAPTPGAPRQAATVAFHTGGDPPRQICESTCPCEWSPDGSLLYVEIERPSRAGAGRMVALPVLPETGLPDLPAAGLRSLDQALAIAGSRVVERSGIVPGIDRGTYAYVKVSVHRNLFRVTLP